MSASKPQENAPILTDPDALRHVHARHDRSFTGHRVVYPVVSRRAGGVSLGINLNPDKICNFDCVYCQVDRSSSSAVPLDGEEAILSHIEPELKNLIALHRDGTLFTIAPFDRTPEPLRRLADIAFSGDGEPSTFRRLPGAVETVIRVKEEAGLPDLPVVLITNASGLDRPETRRALARLDQTGGEVWAKLDAGTEEFFRRVSRTKVSFEKILRNILETARERPVVIQTCFFAVNGVAPSADEIRAYVERLSDLEKGGGKIRAVQIYSVARNPAEAAVTPLTADVLETIALEVRNGTGFSVAVYP